MHRRLVTVCDFVNETVEDALNIILYRAPNIVMYSTLKRGHRNKQNRRPKSGLVEFAHSIRSSSSSSGSTWFVVQRCLVLVAQFYEFCMSSSLGNLIIIIIIIVEEWIDTSNKNNNNNECALAREYIIIRMNVWQRRWMVVTKHVPGLWAVMDRYIEERTASGKTVYTGGWMNEWMSWESHIQILRSPWQQWSMVSRFAKTKETRRRPKS